MGTNCANAEHIYLLWNYFVIIVAILTYYGFSVADMVFAVYGAQLSLFPPILLGLLFGKERLKSLSRYAKTAIVAGFTAGWGIGITEKTAQRLIEMELFQGDILYFIDAVASLNLTFSAPLISLGISTVIMGIGVLVQKTR